jgi:hypothetical protein
MFKMDHQKENLIRFALPSLSNGPIMDPQIIKNIVVMDLVCETSHCALKDINTIYPKNMNFWAI